MMMAAASSVRRHVVGAVPRVSLRLGGPPVTTYTNRISPELSAGLRALVDRGQSWRFSTSGANEKDDSAASPENNAKDAQQPQQSPLPLTHFPWRHEPEPPARIAEMDDFSGMPNNARARFVRRLVACRELGLTTWEGVSLPFFTHQWEDDLAGNFKIAFGLAIEELMKRTFRGAVKVTKAPNDAVESVSFESSAEADTETNGSRREHEAYLNSMFEDKLVQEFQTIDFDRLRLKLAVRPVTATLQHIFAV